ncbi:MAG: OmpA family protein [Alphaproteobacteria bacterium]|nr:OmpA family protein [Alphaproteobacteria bacterium]
MKNKSVVSTWIIARMMALASVTMLGACAGMRGDDVQYMTTAATPTVDYVESLDVYSAPHKDSFLNQLAMNYRSYAIYNARTSGYADMGELFAQKAVAAFSGELPFPETLSNWPVEDEQTAFELSSAYNELMNELMNDASENNPELAAEAQAKFDCWLSAAASGQKSTARECRTRFNKTMTALRDCRGGKIVSARPSKATTTTTTETTVVEKSARRADAQTYYPETRNMGAMTGTGRTREGVIIVNNVNVPEHLINPVPVQPMVFNQNIYGGDKSMSNSLNNNGNDSSKKEFTRTASAGEAVWTADTTGAAVAGGATAGRAYIVEEQTTTTTATRGGNVSAEEIPMIGDELVSRDEFINMMMAMRAELQAINARLDKIQAAQNDKTMIKVQQIPLEPSQHIMEEVFEIHFDFNKATIKPEYQELIQKLAGATQANKNIKVSVVGHTDTSGSKDYNYSLGGRRAEAVQNMLIKYGIPASQIVAVSAGEEDLAVPTPDGTPNAQNRRVRVVKEVYSTDKEQVAAPVAIEVTEVSAADCGMYGCDQ